MTDSQLNRLKMLADELDLEISCNIGPAKQYDVASGDPLIRANGIRFLTSIMERMEQLGSHTLAGVIYTFGLMTLLIWISRLCGRAEWKAVRRWGEPHSSSESTCAWKW